MTTLGQEAFTREAWSLVGRKVSKARLINDIYETACASVALPVDEESVAVAMFRMVIAQARSLIRQRDEIERTANAMLSENRDYQLLRMIPGIGPINALTILAEAGDLRRFNHHRQFLKFCGSTWPPVSQAPSEAEPSSRSTAMPGYAAPSGWRPGRHSPARQQFPRQAWSLCGRPRQRP
jgi:hypothetical protein